MTHPPLRVLSYNVRYFGHALRGLASTRTSMRGIAAGIAALDPLPALVCLQEVETISLRSRLAFAKPQTGETQLEAFMTELVGAFAAEGLECPFEAYYFRAHVNALRSVPIYTTGLAILVDETALRVDHHNAEAPKNITHHHVLRWKDRKQTRICAHLKVADARDRPLHIFNTHLSLPTPFAKEFWTVKDKMGFGVNQLEEARTLAAFVREHARGEPFIVCGDFNSPPGSPVYRYLTEEAGLIGAQEHLKAIDAREPRGYPTAGFLRLRMHLDHLFSGGGVRWMDLDGTRPFGDRSSDFAGRSDHVPLIARCAIE